MGSSIAEKTGFRSQDVAVRLGADRLSKVYGNVVANSEVSLAIGLGEIHAVVGENGAGKSTLMRLLQGIEQPDSGSIIVDDQPVNLPGPQRAFSLGIGMVHQEFMLAPELTLLENLVLGEEPVKSVVGPFSRIDWAEARRSGAALAKQAAIEIDWNRSAGTTPVHVRQFVEIIRLLRRGARILILDEPTAVLAPRQVEDLISLLQTLRDQGTTIVFISHKLKEVMALADRVTVMRRGKVCFQSDIAETTLDEIAGHMIGGADEVSLSGSHSARSDLTESTDIALDIRAISTGSVERSHPLHEIDLRVYRGEIVGIAGVSGNGQHELVECLVGLRSSSQGTVELNGHDITALENGDRRKFGMGYVSADRRHEGLAINATIEANTIAGSHRTPPIRNGWFLDRSRSRKTAHDRLERLDVRFDSLSNAVSSLSGGNQQKLVFAREIAPHPKVLVVSQPTRGVDLVGIAAIHDILRKFRDEDGSVLLVSEELDEILELSDRIYVMANGRIVGERRRVQTDITEIGNLMLAGEDARV